MTREESELIRILDDTQLAITEDSLRRFPGASPALIWEHLSDEILELHEDRTDPMECGDVAIMLMRHCQAHDISLGKAIVEAMRKNKEKPSA